MEWKKITVCSSQNSQEGKVSPSLQPPPAFSATPSPKGARPLKIPQKIWGQKFWPQVELYIKVSRSQTVTLKLSEFCDVSICDFTEKKIDAEKIDFKFRNDKEISKVKKFDLEQWIKIFKVDLFGLEMISNFGNHKLLLPIEGNF